MRAQLISMLPAAILALSACNKPEPTTVDADEAATETHTFATPTLAPVAPTNLDKIIGFNDLEYCVPSADFEKLLAGLLPTGPLGEPIEPYKPSFPGEYASAFGRAALTKDGYTSSANVQVSGIWQKLPVSQLAVWQTQESDYAGFTMTFNAPFQEALQTLNNLGFKLPASGKREAGEELVSYIHLESKTNKTTFTCSSG